MDVVLIIGAGCGLVLIVTLVIDVIDGWRRG